MQDRWSEEGARQAVDRWGGDGIPLALRTFSSRLIGAEPDLVVHGGGNTSAKGAITDRFGDEIPVLWVKGSGWDLGSIEPQGFTPVALGPLRRTRGLPALSDEDMVEVHRRHRLRSDAPDPSIETLLHAFLPHAFVDHSHADAILGLTNRSDAVKHVQDALGDRVGIVPYVKPGFDLAIEAIRIYEHRPDVVGLVLLHHGLFTFGPDAEAAYRRHVELVSAAERYLDQRARRTVVGPVDAGRAARIGPVLRGVLRELDPAERRFVLHHRETPLAGEPDLAEWAPSGPLTPDHVIRTKPRALCVDVPEGGEAEALTSAVRAYTEAYGAYYERCAGGRPFTKLDPLPRAVWVPGVGLFGIGLTAAEASAVADIAEHTVATKRRAAGTGPFAALPDQDLFEMEYWSLEQAKLGKAQPPLFAGRVALITGAGGAIGVGIAAELLAAGAHVVLTDKDPERLRVAAEAVGGGARVATVLLDVTDAASVTDGFAAACRAYGGVDVVVVNAGVAVPGRIADLTDEQVARATEINLLGAHRTLRAAANLLTAQRIGGDIVLVSTKNVAAPGAEFGAYSATKAGAHQLARVAALELASIGVRVNLVAPDAVFAEGKVTSGLWDEIGPARAAARGMTAAELPAFYRGRNLLRAEVTGSHVGKAVVFLASGQVPTTGCVLPVDGGLPDAFPR